MGRPAKITRDELLSAARATFARKGYEATTLADIAGQLGITPAAILRHASSKDDLFAQAMGLGDTEVPPFFLELESVDGSSDPRSVLLNLAESYFPFAQRRLEENIAVYMREKSAPVLPFLGLDPENTPPVRAVAILEHYFQRAAKAGVVRMGDARAAALMFMGSLFSYVFFHHVFRVPPYPLDRYLAALLELWTEGALEPQRGAKRKRSGGTRGR